MERVTPSARGGAGRTGLHRSGDRELNRIVAVNVQETTLRLLHLPYSQIAEFQGCAFGLKADIAFHWFEASPFPG